MSELVEKVARAMHSHPSTFDGVRYENEEPEYRKIYEDKARAAIAAVAEWLDNSHKLDDDSKVSLALRAAAGGGEK